MSRTLRKPRRVAAKSASLVAALVAVSFVAQAAAAHAELTWGWTSIQPTRAEYEANGAHEGLGLVQGVFMRGASSTSTLSTVDSCSGALSCATSASGWITKGRCVWLQVETTENFVLDGGGEGNLACYF